MKIVLEANQFVSAFISLSGAPARVLNAWRAGRFTVISSEALRSEVREVVARPGTMRFFRATTEAVSTVLTHLDATATFVRPDAIRAVHDDPDDDIVLGTATAGEADYIVTGDKHLLTLGSFRGIQIVTPAHFLHILGDEP